MCIPRTILTGLAASLAALAGAALFAIAAATPAAATAIQYELNQNFALCNTGCGTVTVTDITGGVKVDVELNSNVSFVDTGAGGTYAFSFSLSGMPSPDISSETMLVSPTPSYPSKSPGFSISNSDLTGTSYNADGSGYWDYGIKCNYTKSTNGKVGDCSGSELGGQSLIFEIIDSSISTGSFIPSTFSGNGPHPTYYFAADVCVGVTSGSCTGSTGIVAAGAGTILQHEEVPEPATLMLMGGGLVALSFLRRKRRAA
jgi:PEP-CTERM motif